MIILGKLNCHPPVWVVIACWDFDAGSGRSAAAVTADQPSKLLWQQTRHSYSLNIGHVISALGTRLPIRHHYQPKTQNQAQHGILDIIVMMEAALEFDS